MSSGCPCTLSLSLTDGKDPYQSTVKASSLDRGAIKDTISQGQSDRDKSSQPTLYESAGHSSAFDGITMKSRPPKLDLRTVGGVDAAMHSLQEAESLLAQLSAQLNAHTSGRIVTIHRDCCYLETLLDEKRRLIKISTTPEAL